MQGGQHVRGGSQTSRVAQLWCSYLPATQLLFEKRRQMTPSLGIWGKTLSHRPWYLWVTFTTSVSAAGPRWMGTSKPGHWLRNMEGKLLTQAFHEWSRGVALLDLFLTNEEKLLDDVQLKSSLACSEQETVDFRVHRGPIKTDRVTV